MSIICDAIRNRTLVEFDYDGKRRVVQPYCHGVTSKDVEVLRAIQIAGESSSGGLGFGKLWHVAKMKNVRATAESFLPTDPNYNPNDSVMQRIHCCI